MRNVVFVLTFGALFGGIFALSNDAVFCYSKKQLQRLQTYYTEIYSEDNLCRPTLKFVEGSKIDMQACSTTLINIDLLGTVVTDLCTNKTGLNKVFKDNEACLMEQAGGVNDCMKNIPPKPYTRDVEVLVRFIESQCRRMIDAFTCMGNSVGKPCGEAAEHLVRNVTWALSLYQHGVCRQFHHDYYGSAAGHLMHWSLLLGLLLACFTWNKLSIL